MSGEPSLLDSLDVPSVSERSVRKISRSTGADSSRSTLFEEAADVDASTVYSAFYDSDDERVATPATAANDADKPRSAPSLPTISESDRNNNNNNDDNDDETEEDIARRVQQRKIEALLRRQRAAAGYTASAAAPVVVTPPPVPVVVTPPAAPAVAVPVAVVAAVEELTPQQQRAKALAMRNARLSSPFMSGPQQQQVVVQQLPVIKPAPQQAPAPALPAVDDWRHDSDRFLSSLRSTSSVSSTGATASASAAYAYETPDLPNSQRTYGYEAESSASYSMPDIATVASASEISDDSDAYAEPAPAAAAAPAKVLTSSAPPKSLSSSTSSTVSASLSSLTSSATAPLVRAWNEEFQRLWTAHLQADQRLRLSIGSGEIDRPGDELDVMLSLGQLVSEFTTAAKRIGCQIISETFLAPEQKTIRPIAVGGVGGGLKFVVDGIFFKFVVDQFDLYGGNENAMKSASHEFRHLQVLMSHVIGGSLQNLPVLHFPMMTLITWRGFRLIATTQLPIDSSTIEYGSSNAAITVHASSTVAPVMQQIAKDLNLAPHHVVSRDGRQRILLHACADVEVHLGRDNRLYALDLHRMMPPTMPPVAPASPDAPNKLVAVRKNANLYYLFRPAFVRAHSKPLSPDAFSGFADRAEAAEQNRACREATVHLLDVVVPQVARELEERVARLGRVGALRRLVEFLHRRGINMRFLGYVRSATRHEALRCALMTEMMSRTIKQLLNTAWRKLQTVLLQDYCDVVYRMFNECVFGGAKKLRSAAWWSNDGPAALTQRFARAFDKSIDGSDLRALVDERMLYGRLREMTGVDFGEFDRFCGFVTDGVQHTTYTILELAPVVHRLYVLPVFEATLLQQEATPAADAPLAEQTAFFERVRALFVESLTTRPEDVVALDGLGLAFKQHAVVMAKHRRGSAALQLFAEALECFRDALAIAPASHRAVLHFDHGVTLAALARATIDARRARIDDSLRQQVIDELLAEAGDDQRKRAHADMLRRRLDATMADADSAPLLAPSDEQLAALFTQAAQQFAEAATLNDRDFDALFNRAHCVLMAEIVSVLHDDAAAAQREERERKAHAFRSSESTPASLQVPGAPRRVSASLGPDSGDNDAFLLAEARRSAALQACELAQTLCDQAVQLQIAATGQDPNPADGDQLPPRAAALVRLRQALEADTNMALAIAGRRSPRSERRRERLRSLSPVQQPVVRSWPPKREEVERDVPAAATRGDSDSERSEDEAQPAERGFK